MFCDGNCKKGNKRCGLLLDITMKEEVTGKIEVRQECALQAIFSSLARLEQAAVRIQAALESQRNESVNTGEDISRTIATGFLSLVQSSKGEKSRLEEALSKEKDLIE
jgi:hypothetical protein